MRIKPLRKENKAYIELPDNLTDSEEIEIFALRDGYYLLSRPLDGLKKQPPPKSTPKQNSPSLAPEEVVLLKKLLDIQFQKRIPKLVAKNLGQNEQKVLLSLLQKNYINIFKSNKYPEGVYNINDSVYPLLKGNAKSNPIPASTKSEVKPVQPKLQWQYLIIDNPIEAKEFSEKFKSEIRSGGIIATRGFDGKFYAIRKEYYLGILPKVHKILEKDSDVVTIAKELNIEKDESKAILTIMSDKGEVIEKKKGLFALV